MMHTTKQFKTDGIIMGANTIGLIPQRLTVRYSKALEQEPCEEEEEAEEESEE